MRKEVKLRVWGSWRSLKVDEGWSVNKDGRIGSSFLLAGGLASMGAPLFAFFANGGRDALCSAGFDFLQNLTAQAVSYPPLQKPQGRGTQIAIVSAR